MKKEKMNIIKLGMDTSGYEYGEYDNVKFFEELSAKELINSAELILEAYGEVFSIEETFEKWMKAKGIEDEVMQTLYEDMQMYNDNYHTVEEFKEDFTATEYIDGSWEHYFPELVDFHKELEEFFSHAGLDFGTVGYSPWSYCLSKGYDSSTLRDIYENWNFYTVTLIEDGIEVDFCGNIYIPDVKELKDTVQDIFGVKEFYLVDNDEATYMNVPKVKEIVEHTYTYEVI